MKSVWKDVGLSLMGMAAMALIAALIFGMMLLTGNIENMDWWTHARAGIHSSIWFFIMSAIVGIFVVVVRSVQAVIAIFRTGPR